MAIKKFKSALLLLGFNKEPYAQNTWSYVSNSTAKYSVDLSTKNFVFITIFKHVSFFSTESFTHDETNKAYKFLLKELNRNE